MIARAARPRVVISPAQLERDRAEHQGRSDERAGPEWLVEHGRAHHGADERCDVGVGTDQRRRRAGQQACVEHEPGERVEDEQEYRCPDGCRADVRPTSRIELAERQREQQQHRAPGEQLNRVGDHAIGRSVGVRRRQAPRGPQDRRDAECRDRPWRPADRAARRRQHHDRDAAEPGREPHLRRERHGGADQPAQEHDPQRDRRREDRAETGGHLGQRHHREPLPTHQQQHAGNRQAPQLRARGHGPPTRRHSKHEPGDQEDQRRPAERRHRIDHQLHRRNRRAPARIEREQQEQRAVGGRRRRPCGHALPRGSRRRTRLVAAPMIIAKLITTTMLELRGPAHIVQTPPPHIRAALPWAGSRLGTAPGIEGARARRLGCGCSLGIAIRGQRSKRSVSATGCSVVATPLSAVWSGGGGIRTLGTGGPGSTVFKTVAFNRSATPPGRTTRI